MLNRTISFNVEAEILAGREQGEKLRRSIINTLKQNALDTLMPLNFEKVKFIDFSCADELISKIIRRLSIKEDGEKYIILENMNNMVEENIIAALKARKLIAVGMKERHYILYGKITQEIETVFNLAVKKQQITARNLIEFKLVEKINVASNRLNKLCELGIMRRQIIPEIVKGGGRQYVYEPIV